MRAHRGEDAREWAVLEAERLVRSRFAAWNRADPHEVRAALHVPHISLAGPRLSIRESEPDLLGSPDFRALASVESWHSSALARIDVDHASPDKVHCLVRFGRNAADGARYADGQGVYVVTNRDGRWGIQLSSSTLRPIGVGGTDDAGAVAAAANVLRLWVGARDCGNPAVLRRLVHLPFIELDGAALRVHRNGTALRRCGAVVPAGRCSELGPMEVRERSAHKVTLETEIARYGPGGALVARDHALAIVTHLQGRWGMQVYSSFLTSSNENERR
jgi:hypothetical protein